MRLTTSLPPLTLALVTLMSAPALAAPGWDWEEEFSSRFWRNDSLAWAQDIHPEYINTNVLEYDFTPPPREMWCGVGRPSATDLQIHQALLNEWLRDFLNIPQGQPLPQNLPQFPPECYP